MNPYGVQTQGFLPVPKLLMPEKVFKTMMGYVVSCAEEVGGFSMIRRVGTDLEVYDVFLMEQVVGPGEFNADAEAVGRCITELVRARKPTQDMHLLWHSHVGGFAGFSPTDVAQIHALGVDWMVSLVLNHRGEWEARLDVYKPFRVCHPLELVVLLDLEDELLEQCRSDIMAKVRGGGNLLRRPRRPTIVSTQVAPLQGSAIGINGEEAPRGR